MKLTIPQSLHPHSIRDSDLRALLSCDLALFTYDGAELDAGTVVEYLVAKFADIPAVILRTDFRGGGDQGQFKADETAGKNDEQGDEKADSWNLMSSFWPRTCTVSIDSMGIYKTALSDAVSTSASNSEEGKKISGRKWVFRGSVSNVEGDNLPGRD
jgi:nucleoside 2-deoxyribosyltransferase